MIRKFKKGLACALVAALTFAAAAPVTADAADSPTKAPVTETKKDVVGSTGGVKATVNTSKNGSATLKAVAKTSKKSVSVGSTVTVNGVKYTVKTVDAKAFANCTKATSITLPTTIANIKASAFTGAKKVKTVVLKSTGAVKVNKKAFKGVSTKKMTIKVNKKMSKKNYNALVKALRKAGFKGKIKRTAKSYK